MTGGTEKLKKQIEDSEFKVRGGGFKKKKENGTPNTNLALLEPLDSLLCNSAEYYMSSW